jgi:phosphate transport system substrate-binding protein
VSVVLGLALLSCGRSGDGGGGRVLIQNKGSDTLVNVAQAWAEAYAAERDDVAVAVTGGGSGTGFSALVNGTVDIANASRRITQRESDLARSRGVEPVEFIVGYDALAVYLHPNNPLQSLTLEQLARIYGEDGDVVSWDQLGVTVPGCSSGEIVRVSRQNSSGTFAYFRRAVLGKAHDFKLGSRDMHGSKDVVELVTNTPCAIGYSGLAYTTHEVKMAAIAVDPDSEPVTPTVESAFDGSYPIARPLFMYTSGQPTGAVKTYLDWILSDEGQCIIQVKGYAPVRPISCDPS